MCWTSANDTFPFRSTRFVGFTDSSNDIDPPLLAEGQSDDVDIIIRPNSSRSVGSNGGNNILNSNLSGSFREGNALPNDDDDDDDEILDGRVIRAPRHKRKHRSAPNILTSDQPSTSYDVPSSSFAPASPGDRLGVVAIPNIQFDPRPGPNGGNNFI